MLPIPEAVKTVIKEYLEDVDCCHRCILKYLGYRKTDGGWEPFLYPKLHSVFNTDDSDDQHKSKKIKSNPCRACLDVLSDSTMEFYLATLPKGFEEYKMKEFTMCISFPIAMLIRERSMFIYLKEKFPNECKDLEFSNMQRTKSVFKKVSSNILAAKLNKTFKEPANFQINIKIDYCDEEKETQNISKLKAKNRSRFVIADVLNNCTDEVFKKYFPVPPNIQDKGTVATISYSSLAVYLGGRYLKFSREMGQTPFVVNNKAITESSVYDMLSSQICTVLGCDERQLTFSSSGREDSDARMVGGGRPFYIQIDSPKFEKVTSEQCTAIEDLILESNAVVVTALQQVLQVETKIIKFGEEIKKKHYRALCKTLAPNLKEVIRVINMFRCPVKLSQNTPLRVLHRRSKLNRDRFIYELRASEVEGLQDSFYLDLTTQAGTYVKEFVNGDFNRTIPSIYKLIGYPTDVVALDVTDVELDWPVTVTMEQN